MKWPEEAVLRGFLDKSSGAHVEEIRSRRQKLMLFSLRACNRAEGSTPADVSHEEGE
jgi:hypothetical protein